MNDSTVQTCRCGTPTRDQHYFCDPCGNQLATALGDVPWLVAELETTITRTRGVDYRTRGGTPSSERPSPVVWNASDARRNLTATLIAWTRYCHDNQVRNSSPRRGLPVETPDAMSRWLLWRIDGLALDPQGPTAVEQLTKAVGQPGNLHRNPSGTYRFIDTAADKMYAGKCSADIEGAECPNELYVVVGAPVVKCRTCGTEWDVPARRTWLLAEAEEMLATAVEISRAVSWLGSEPLTADRVRVWANRKRIVAHTTNRCAAHAAEADAEIVKACNKCQPRYRVGDAIDLLAGNSAKESAA